LDVVFMRSFDRTFADARPVLMEKDVNPYAEGSVIISVGETKVLCTCSVEKKLPPFRLESGQGWLTAEYSMLPRATSTRNAREVSRGKPGGRTMEIQRLIGRSLRSVLDFSLLPGYTLTVDCDVLVADGGTRTASITGGFVAVCLACRKMVDDGLIEAYPVINELAAVSVGVVNSEVLVDLDYEEDSNADADMNIVMTGKGEMVELQATAEKKPFSRSELLQGMDLAAAAIEKLISLQKWAISV
jgi:ribonuclease PH